jgi:hypothetical protein
LWAIYYTMSVSTRRTQRPPSDSNSDTDMEEPQQHLALLPAPCSPDEATTPQTQVIIHHQDDDVGLQPLPYPHNDYRALIDALPSAVHIESYEFIVQQQ